MRNWLRVAELFTPLRSLRRLRGLEQRVEALEQRLRNRRWAALEEVGDYLVGAQIPGDYIEFGVYRGDTFGYAMRVLAGTFKDMRFIACDSFEGLPLPQGIDAHDGFTSNFHPGQFACSEKQFLHNLDQQRVDLTRVMTIKGWFSESLNEETAQRHAITKIAAAWIDGDLYESAVPVLRFLTHRLSVGSILLFDDWRVYRNLPDFGEQLACREWLEANPQLQLREIFSFGHHGIAFTVAAC
jgi:O-methyltransferase